VEDISLPANVTATPVPNTPNVFSSFSHDSSIAFAVPFANLPDFLKAVQEIPDPSTEDEEGEQRKWIMKAARGKRSHQVFKVWVTEAWSSFVDLIKVRIFVINSTAVC